MKFAGLAVFLFLLGSARAAPPSLALSDREELTYHVSWIVVPGAGEIKVSAQAVTDLSGHPQLRIVSTTSTRGLAYLLLPFKARAESLFDPASGRLLWLGESSQTRSRNAVHTVVFDYAKRTADYVSSVPPEPARALAMPPGDPTDLITCLLLARTWRLRPGEKHDALVLFNDDFYELTIHATGYEDIVTPLGSYRTLVLEPKMEKTPPKGLFKRGSTVRVWIAQDPPYLPVRFQVQFKFGSGMATLVDYRLPPAGSPAH
jgi:Protein of unknown function (DUF3108)